jgi:hypothetical protein
MELSGEMMSTNGVHKSNINENDLEWNNSNLEPYSIKNIYGWERHLSTRYYQYYWFNVESSKSSWTIPSNINDRQNILRIQEEKPTYTIGDTVYYLGKINRFPNKKWKIISRFTTTKFGDHINIEFIDDNSDTLENIPYDINLLRHAPESIGGTVDKLENLPYSPENSPYSNIIGNSELTNICNMNHTTLFYQIILNGLLFRKIKELLNKMPPPHTRRSMLVQTTY